MNVRDIHYDCQGQSENKAFKEKGYTCKRPNSKSFASLSQQGSTLNDKTVLKRIEFFLLRVDIKIFSKAARKRKSQFFLTRRSLQFKRIYSLKMFLDLPVLMVCYKIAKTYFSRTNGKVNRYT